MSTRSVCPVLLGLLGLVGNRVANRTTGEAPDPEPCLAVFFAPAGALVPIREFTLKPGVDPEPFEAQTKLGDSIVLPGAYTYYLALE